MSAIHKRRGRVLVEFTEDTFDELGEPKRRKGEQVWVDPASAKSFVDIKAVATLVEVDEPEASELAADAVVEDQELGAVVHTAEDGTETPSVPDSDGFHTLDTSTDSEVKPPAAKAKTASKTSKTTDPAPGADAPAEPVGGA